MQQVLYRVNDAAVALALGRSKVYQLIGRGELRAVRVDGAVRVPGSAIEEFVTRLEADAGSPDRAA